MNAVTPAYFSTVGTRILRSKLNHRYSQRPRRQCADRGGPEVRGACDPE